MTNFITSVAVTRGSATPAFENQAGVRKFAIDIPAGTLVDLKSCLTVNLGVDFAEVFMEKFIFSVTTWYLDSSQPPNISRRRIRDLEERELPDNRWMLAWILTDEDVVQNTLTLWAELDMEKRTITITSATPTTSQGAMSVHFAYKL